MLKTQFKDQLEFDLYKTEQKIRMERGYLTKSERETLKTMLNKDYKPTIKEEEKIKPIIITDINYLKQPCKEINAEDNIEEIIKKLKDALNYHGGLGITANQIGIQKRISYIKVPSKIDKNKIEFKELILINAKIIEKDTKIIVRNEGCLSIPYITVDTDRYVFITVEYLDENRKINTGLSQDLEALVIQHEIDHMRGLTILDRKRKAK